MSSNSPIIPTNIHAKVGIALGGEDEFTGGRGEYNANNAEFIGKHN